MPSPPNTPIPPESPAPIETPLEPESPEVIVWEEPPQPLEQQDFTQG